MNLCVTLNIYVYIYVCIYHLDFNIARYNKLSINEQMVLHTYLNSEVIQLLTSNPVFNSSPGQISCGNEPPPSPQTMIFIKRFDPPYN